jgi:hypothetical protein
METTPQNFGDRISEVQDRIMPRIDEARRNLADFNSRAVSYIRQNPGTCLLGALAFGFVVGKIAARR